MSAATAPWTAVFAVTAAATIGVYTVAAMDRAVHSLVAREPIGWSHALLGPLRTAALWSQQRPTRTERPDMPAWALAPGLLAGLGAVALAVVPLAPGRAAAGAQAGFVVFGAAVAVAMIAVYLHGWSANSSLPLIGGYRFIAQALSLQIPLLLALLGTALPAESLAVGDIVVAQQGLWNVVRQPLGLGLYLATGAGVAFWGPLNLADAWDLAGGTAAETSGIQTLLWRVARGLVLVAIAAMGAAAFLGGYWGPWLPGAVWTVLKTAALLVVLVASGHLLARVRLQRLVLVGWVVLLPLALVDLFVAGVLLL